MWDELSAARSGRSSSPTPGAWRTPSRRSTSSTARPAVRGRGQRVRRLIPLRSWPKCGRPSISKPEMPIICCDARVSSSGIQTLVTLVQRPSRHANMPSDRAARPPRGGRCRRRGPGAAGSGSGRHGAPEYALPSARTVRGPVTARSRQAASSSVNSSAVSSRSAAAESRMVSGRLEPGIGMTTGDLASIQARRDLLRADAVRLGDLRERRVRGAEVAGLGMPPSGLQGRNAMPSSSHRRARARWSGTPGENWFCTETSRPPRISLACADLVRGRRWRCRPCGSCPRRAGRGSRRPSRRRGRPGPAGGTGRARSPRRRAA